MLDTRYWMLDISRHQASRIQYHLYPIFSKVQTEETDDLSLAILTGQRDDIRSANRRHPAVVEHDELESHKIGNYVFTPSKYDDCLAGGTTRRVADGAPPLNPYRVGQSGTATGLGDGLSVFSSRSGCILGSSFQSCLYPKLLYK